MNDYAKTILWSIGLVLAQVVLFNHLQLAYVINVFPYIFVVLAFPNRMSLIARTIVGFLLGFAIDLLCGISGIHAVATTLMAYLQPVILQLIALPEHTDRGMPSLNVMHGKFVTYAAIIIVLHNLLLFGLETFDITLWYWVLLKTLVSSVITLLIVLLFDRINNA